MSKPRLPQIACGPKLWTGSLAAFCLLALSCTGTTASAEKREPTGTTATTKTETPDSVATPTHEQEVALEDEAEQAASQERADLAAHEATKEPSEEGTVQISEHEESDISRSKERTSLPDEKKTDDSSKQEPTPGPEQEESDARSSKEPEEDQATETPKETTPKREGPAPESKAEGGFADWLAAFKVRAAAAGVSKETLDSLDAIHPIARVIELDRRQPERRFTFQQYMARVVPDSRVQEGRRRYSEHREILEAVGEKFGVHPRFLVALWGIETDYGGNTGGFRVLDALATLAHDGRRAAFFESELINALRIVDEGHITPDKMLGSWAGALGQCQFMPSSFMSYAVDFTGDGRRDIWTSLPDVFASSANYLLRHGWQSGQTWGRLVRLPEGFDQSLIGLDTVKSLERWQTLGLRRVDGEDLPTASLQGSLVQPGGAKGPTYLVYDNYRTIMRWNRSHYFATAVGLLADRIGAEP